MDTPTMLRVIDARLASDGQYPPERRTAKEANWATIPRKFVCICSSEGVAACLGQEQG